MFNIKKNDLWWKMPIIYMGVFGLVMFIICSIPINGNYDIDYYISKWMGKGSENVFLKYFSFFYYQVGWTQIIFVLACHILLNMESIYAYKISLKKEKWIKYKETIWFFYAFFIIVWLGVKINIILGCFTTSDYGSTVDFEVMMTAKQQLAPQLILFFIEGIVFSLIIYVLRFKFSKRNDILFNKYWIISTQSIIYTVGFYILTITLKQATGRPEGINNFFYEIVGTPIDENSFHWSNESLKWFINSGQIKDQNAFIHYINNNIQNNGINIKWKPTNYLPWYKVNGNFWSDLKYWQPFAFFDGADFKNAPYGWQVNDFPSGHTFTSFLFITFGLYFKDSKSKKTQNILRILFIFWVFHVFLMMASLQIIRVHWATDVYFTCFTQSAFFFLFMRVGEKLAIRWMANFNVKYKKQENFLVVKTDGLRSSYFIQIENREWFVKTSKNEKIKQKIMKKYQCINEV